MVIAHCCCLLDIGCGGKQRLPWPWPRNVCPAFPQAANILSFQYWLCWISWPLHFVVGYPAPSAPDVCPLIYKSSWMLLKCILHHCQFEVLLVPRNEPRILWSTQGCHFFAPQNWPLHIDWNRQWTSVHTVPHVNWAPRMVLECRWRPARPCVCSSSGFALEMVVHEAWTSNTLHTLRVVPRWGQSAPSWHRWNLGAPSVCARALHPLSSSLSVLEPGHWICIEDSRADPKDTSTMLRLDHIEWPVGHSWRWKCCPSPPPYWHSSGSHCSLGRTKRRGICTFAQCRWHQ